VFRKDNPLHKKNMHYAQKRKKKRKGLMCWKSYD
jgi:hypothetical protein